jgi:FkbM family methyltransferase
MRCIDAGAQTGFYSCLMASKIGPGGHVYAFEPLDRSYAMLVRNVNENQFQDRVESFQIACSDSTSGLEASDVSNMFVMGKVEGAPVVHVPTTTLDESVQGPIDLVKIDVEGHEPAVLRGMHKLIAIKKPIIFSEVNPYWLRTISQTEPQDFLAAIRALGYEIYNAANPGEKVPEALTLGELESIDIVALPEGVTL